MSIEPTQEQPESPVDRLLIAAVPHRLHIGLTLIAKLRLTPVEALSLTWDEVDAADLVLHLPDRDVSITTAFADLLHWHGARQRLDALTGGRPWHADGLVVTDAEGRPFTSERADAITADLAEQVGLPPIPMAALRHPVLR